MKKIIEGKRNLLISMVFRKRMEKQISTETLEILMPFLKVVW